MMKIGYNEAVGKLEEIVKKIEDPNVNLDEVGGLVKQATELIAYCKGELKGYQESFSSLLQEKADD